MAALVTGRTCRQVKKGSRVTPVPAWIFQPEPKPGNHKAGSGQPVANEVMPCVCTRPSTHTTAASIFMPEAFSSVLGVKNQALGRWDSEVVSESPPSERFG